MTLRTCRFAKSDRTFKMKPGVWKNFCCGLETILVFWFIKLHGWYKFTYNLTFKAAWVKNFFVVKPKSDRTLRFTHVKMSKTARVRRVITYYFLKSLWCKVIAGQKLFLAFAITFFLKITHFHSFATDFPFEKH